MTEKNKPDPGVQDYEQNFVISGPFLADVLGYLNTQPRGKVNEMCKALEQAPSVTAFKKMVVDHYLKNPGSTGLDTSPPDK